MVLPGLLRSAYKRVLIWASSGMTKTGSAIYSRDYYHVNALVKANSCNRLSIADSLWGNPSHSATSCAVTACSRATCWCLLREARAACVQQAMLPLQKFLEHLAATGGQPVACATGALAGWCLLQEECAACGLRPLQEHLADVGGSQWHVSWGA